MRGKLVVWGYLVVLSLATMLNLYMPKTEAAQKESIVIPGEAIRLRILANSDFEEDQAIKRKVRDAVNAQITLWVQDLTSMEEARKVIKGHLPEIQGIAEKVVSESGSDQSVNVEFGKVQFPTKLYGQFLYPAGKYQAVLITLGAGEGANWWCVLYPPLCFLDFSNGVAVSEGFEEKETAAVAEAKEDASSVAQLEEKRSDVKTKSVEGKKEKVVQQKKTEVERPDFEEARTNGDTNEDDIPVMKSRDFNKTETAVVKKHGSEKTKTAVVKKQESLEKTEAVVVEKQESLEKTEAAVVEKQDSEKAEAIVVKKPVKKDKPVYVSEDEQPVKVKFFVVEIWNKLFN
ncbi:stage II sporulation protein R [Neobacillus rhizophilus]|uniref:Stage II sporulation protein R n=1 Tax=Neobacillus rhizophilus TaxID=2833579 RepID=A0A942YV30_9BACI|nr:stage II sporulation protein R [Neobacillus rhizophilus]